MLAIAVALLAVLVVGILLAPLGAGIVVVATVVVVAIVGFAVWGPDAEQQRVDVGTRP